ncbi:LysR substrate-binding domain-containing protein [Phenylobacterium sp.]|uniref:LysR substrate-binding domain-containing protein n=1 Tax=Phenylobacterium sp. TaxID=1871053 RepID=UPI002600C4FA|nr:LysR substrate-binding domain-containing protein [Phenylobacterium sp.]
MQRKLDQLLKFRQLRMLDALARHQSLTRAAGTIGVTQPALTKMVRELEELLGEPLFERHARGVRPTAVGQVVTRYARRALADLHRLEEELDLAGEPGHAAVVVAGALPVAAVGIMPAVIRRVRAEHANLQVRIVEGRTETLLAQLEAGEVDLVVGRLYPPVAPDALRREALYAEPISVMARAGHPLQRLRRPTAKDLAAFDLVLPTFSQRISHDVEHFMTSGGLEAGPGTIRSTSRGFIREMVLSTDMLTVMPRMVMGGDLLRREAIVLPAPAPAFPRPAGVITNPQRGVSRAAGLFVQVVRDTLADLAGSGDFDITR